MRLSKAKLRKLEKRKAVNEPLIARVIRWCGARPFNFWDVVSVTIRDEATIQRKGNFKDYQTLIDLEQEARDMINTLPDYKRIIVCFNMADGVNQVFDGVLPDDVINMHLSEDDYRKESTAMTTVHMPHNHRD